MLTQIERMELFREIKNDAQATAFIGILELPEASLPSSKEETSSEIEKPDKLIKLYYSRDEKDLVIKYVLEGLSTSKIASKLNEDLPAGRLPRTAASVNRVKHRLINLGELVLPVKKVDPVDYALSYGKLPDPSPSAPPPGINGIVRQSFTDLMEATNEIT